MNAGTLVGLSSGNVSGAGDPIGMVKAMPDMGPTVSLPNGQVWLRSGDYVASSSAPEVSSMPALRLCGGYVGPAFTGNPRNIASNGSGTLVTQFNNALFRSTDNGATWSSVTPIGLSGFTSYGGIAFGGGFFSMCGSNAGNSALILARSSDGITWTQGTANSSSPFSLGMYMARSFAVYTGTRFVYAIETGSLRGVMVSSTDGITQTTIYDPGSLPWSTQQPVTVATDGSGRVLVFGSLTPQTAYFRSLDHGVNWSQTSTFNVTPTSNIGQIVVNSEGVFCASGSQGNIDILYFTNLAATSSTSLGVRVQSIFSDGAGGKCYALTARNAIYEVSPTGLSARPVGQASALSIGYPTNIGLGASGFIFGSWLSGSGVWMTRLPPQPNGLIGVPLTYADASTFNSIPSLYYLRIA